MQRYSDLLGSELPCADSFSMIINAIERMLGAFAPLTHKQAMMLNKEE